MAIISTLCSPPQRTWHPQETVLDISRSVSMYFVLPNLRSMDVKVNVTGRIVLALVVLAGSGALVALQ